MQKEVYGTDDFDYLLYEPQPRQAQKNYPLILFLHGSGERGDDLNAVRRIALPQLLDRAEYPAFVVSPQCKADLTWVSQTEKLHRLIKRIVEAYPIDPDALSVTGLSMGGFGVFQMIMDYPRLFCAAAPLCGGGTAWRADRIAHLPIRIYHGEKDDQVDCFYSQDIYRRLQSCNAADASLILYPTLGHNIWDEVYPHTDVIEWLLSKRKGADGR